MNEFFRGFFSGKYGAGEPRTMAPGESFTGKEYVTTKTQVEKSKRAIRKDLMSKPFDPEGRAYDYKNAIRAGLKPDSSGHWPSRDPKTGLILKGRGHRTYWKTERDEEKLGYLIRRSDVNGRYYSRKGFKVKPPQGDVVPDEGRMLLKEKYLQFIKELGQHRSLDIKNMPRAKVDPMHLNAYRRIYTEDEERMNPDGSPILKPRFNIPK